MQINTLIHNINGHGLETLNTIHSTLKKHLPLTTNH